jgi:sigma-B regulation protein RsbU (phosphoserine phosphatase)
VAAFLIHFTIMPGFLGSARQVATLAMFCILFSALGILVAWAAVFYRRAIDRAKSEEELTVARRIQRSFLLSHFPAMPRLEVHALNVSSRQVSGDFYDVVSAGDSAFLLAIADVAGKGVPAALLSSMLQASLRTQANTPATVSAILSNINSLVYRSTEVHQFATFFLARIEEDRLRMSYSNAGHNHPLVFRRDGACLPLDRGGTVVGIMEGTRFDEDEVELRPGDRVIFYTDGISEAANPGGELFGEERLCQLVSGLPEDLSARETTERIMEGVRGFLDGTDAGDDMTLMVLRVLDSETPTDARTASEASSPARG